MKKQCSKCCELKDESLFSKRRNQCKECRKQHMKQYHRKYYLDHKEEHKQYRLDHKEQRKQYSKQYWLNNKEKIKKYCIDNKEKIKKRSEQYYLDTIVERKRHSKQYEMDHKEQRKQYRMDHKEEEKQRGKKYRINHREEKKIYSKQYRVNNRDKIKQYWQSEAGKLAQKKHTAKKRKMKFISLINNPFPEEISVDYHHILNNFHAIDAEGTWNKWFVIPIPEITHKYIGGSTNNLEHWKFNTLWIRKLYGINIKELLNGI